MKSGDFCAQLQKMNSMDKQQHYFRSINIDDEQEVNLVDR